MHEMLGLAFAYSRKCRAEVDLQLIVALGVLLQPRTCDESETVRFQMCLVRVVFKRSKEARRIRSGEQVFGRDAAFLAIRGKIHRKLAVRALDPSIPSAFRNHFRDMDRL